ncbi:MAG: hypothetical protein IJ917_06275 [Firmicutes bacterium]|nr:hypothetical protein [Bacillota bacterium]
MNEVLLPVIIGIVIIILGVMNMKGNISTLHRYHRQRVSEEDKIPFGKKVGLGTIIVGCAVIGKACFQYAAEKRTDPAIETVGTIVLIAGFVIGFALIIYAMIKYNKGLF